MPCIRESNSCIGRALLDFLAVSPFATIARGPSGATLRQKGMPPQSSTS